MGSQQTFFSRIFCWVHSSTTRRVSFPLLKARSHKDTCPRFLRTFRSAWRAESSDWLPVPLVTMQSSLAHVTQQLGEGLQRAWARLCGFCFPDTVFSTPRLKSELWPCNFCIPSALTHNKVRAHQIIPKNHLSCMHSGTDTKTVHSCLGQGRKPQNDPYILNSQGFGTGKTSLIRNPLLICFRWHYQQSCVQVRFQMLSHSVSKYFILYLAWEVIIHVFIMQVWLA